MGSYGTDIYQEPSRVERKRPVIQWGADIVEEKLEWLWPGRIPLGKVTVIAGVPGLGKSLISLDIASRVTTGRPWADQRDGKNPVGDVLIISGEDGVSDTVAPRLRLAGADKRRYAHMKTVKELDYETGEESERMFNIAQDADMIKAAACEMRNLRLVIIDPASGFLGNIESHNDGKVRTAYMPIVDLADRHGFALLLVYHLNKNHSAAALARVQGSGAIVALARAVWMIVAAKDDKTKRLFLPGKCNLGPDTSGLSYSTVPSVEPEHAVIHWNDAAEAISIDEALSAVHVTPSTDEAAGWLKNLLADGNPKPSKEVRQAATAAGLAWDTLLQAKERLGIKVNKLSMAGGWSWSLPAPPSQYITTSSYNRPILRDSDDSQPLLRRIGLKTEEVVATDGGCGAADDSDRLEREAIQSVEADRELFDKGATSAPGNNGFSQRILST